MVRSNRIPILPATLLIVLPALAGCGDEPASRPDESDAGSVEAEDDRSDVGRVYERSFVFTTLDRDSTVVVPIFFSARTVPGGVERAARGWLGRAEAWEPFLDERWETPPTRVPWRVLPRGAVRLIVGEDDAMDAIVYDGDARRLEVDPGASLVEWTGSRSETFHLREGELVFPDRRIPGYVLDVSRARRAPEPAHGDWALLTSGDSLHVVLSAPEEGPADGPGRLQGFARLDFRELRWPEVSARWSETRAFEPARRDVPDSWSVATPGGELDGDLEVVGVHLEVGRGSDGPVLPVEALYQVRGTLRIQGAEYPVRGFLRHRRG